MDRAGVIRQERNGMMKPNEEVFQAQRNGAFQGTGDWPEYAAASQLGMICQR
ncbi:hypothetical protein [Aneurinibacillus aneurinilyticus]|uniref:hypothetical protein n=1 Tax=Aneurinibacillus aneurinilyticus TaxID=1391 RepID=UPI00352469C7